MHHDETNEPSPTTPLTAQPEAPPPPPGEEDPPAGRRRWVLAALAALGVMLFAVPLLRGPDTHIDESASNAPAGVPGAVGNACPVREGTANFNFTMRDINGADVKLADFKGKVVLLNFWATWCAPCRVEIPEFVEVYQQYKDQGFEIIGVLAQDDPSRDDLQAFASSFKMNYPVFRANEEFESAHGGIWALPTSYIIDRHGSICSKHMGPISHETLEREIKGLL